MTPGRLFLVPNLLGVVPPERVLPPHTIAVARGLAHYVVENAKPARAFLQSLSPERPIREIAIVEIGQAALATDYSALLEAARSGQSIGLLSDAGCPGIADPGAQLVAQAHREGIRVIPLVGPSSITLALMASGMNGQTFTFHGYVPVKAEARATVLKRLEADSRRDGGTQIFIETPYRNVALLAALVSACAPTTLLCVAADLTLESETVVARTIAQWRGVELGQYARRPAVFLLQAALQG